MGGSKAVELGHASFEAFVAAHRTAHAGPAATPPPGEADGEGDGKGGGAAALAGASKPAGMLEPPPELGPLTKPLTKPAATPPLPPVGAASLGDTDPWESWLRGVPARALYVAFPGYRPRDGFRGHRPRGPAAR